MFFRKTPFLIRKMFPKIYWRFDNTSEVFLTFDDGPHPQSTPQLLDLLSEYKIKATFFLLGKNMKLYPNLVNRIQEEGHILGFHGEEHLSGWNSNTDKYIDNSVSEKITTQLYRPPYGRLKWSQYFRLIDNKKIIMWDVMPGDFIEEQKKEKCLENIKNHLKKGSIIVLHDTPNTIKKLEFMIPKLNEFVIANGMLFGKINDELVSN